MTAADRPSASRRERVSRSLLGGGLLYLGLFLVVHAFLSVTGDGFMPVDPLLLLLTGTPQTVLVLRRRLDLPAGATAAVCACLLSAAVIGVSSLPRGEEAEGYAAWFIGAITFNLLGLTVVGRFGAAWGVLAGVGVVTVSWSLLTGTGIAIGIALVVRHAATLLVGTALAVGLRRSNAAFQAFRTVERRRTAEEVAAGARSAARRSGAEAVLEQAGPLLRTIADGTPLSDDERLEMLVVEGALRDGIRTPGLAFGPLPAAAAAARRRGVNVLLLDEAAEVQGAVRDRAVHWLADELAGTTGSRFVGRVHAEESGARVSAVTDGGQHAAHLG